MLEFGRRAVAAFMEKMGVTGEKAAVTAGEKAAATAAADRVYGLAIEYHFAAAYLQVYVLGRQVDAAELLAAVARMDETSITSALDLARLLDPLWAPPSGVIEAAVSGLPAAMSLPTPVARTALTDATARRLITADAVAQARNDMCGRSRGLPCDCAGFTAVMIAHARDVEAQMEANLAHIRLAVCEIRDQCAVAAAAPGPR